MKKILLILLLFITPAYGKVRVVDGDSLEIDGARIRMDGIDAPEFFQLCQTAEGEDYACGQEARQYLQDLIGEQEIQCDCLPEPDKYNRRICECFVGTVSLNRAMVKNGYARVYRSEKYETDEEEAAVNHHGIWRGKHMRPPLYRILHKR